MLPRRSGDGRHTAGQNKLLLAFAIIVLPWLQLASAQQQSANAAAPEAIVQQAEQVRVAPAERVVPDLDATQVDTVTGTRETIVSRSPSRNNEKRQQPRRQTNNNQNAVQSDDASAIATLAPADAVRAPHLSRHRGSSSSAAGISSPQSARSLGDWEVEDFVLLATVDGDLYASDRKTGKELWHLEVDQPMVETKHFRVNNSVLDEDYSPVDHYIWAVEPSQDGGVFVWIPDAGVGLVRTDFTMKRLVEELAPYAPQEDPAVVYTGDKKTTMVTLDAATGRVLKWFGSSGSHINEVDSCLQPNTFEGQDEECSTIGTITLGRTEYTVGIQRQDGRPIATLKYSEWGPNNFDSDLMQQYHTSLDSRYITSRHDGKVYAFDHSRAEKMSPLFSHKFSAPVARVFDVCRPWDAVSGSNPQLVVLPQPTMPSPDEAIAMKRSNRIFLNQTEAGSWYAMSGRSYPLIIHAPRAQASDPNGSPSWETAEQNKINNALVGTHYLDSIRGTPKQLPSLPGTVRGDGYEESEVDPTIPLLPAYEPLEQTIVTKVKSLPKSAANSIVDFVSNPILIILFIGTLMYNHDKLRRSYSRMRVKGVMRELNDVFGQPQPDEKEKLAKTEPKSTQEPNDKKQTAEAELKDEAQPPKVEEQASVSTAAKEKSVDAKLPPTPPADEKGAATTLIDTADKADPLTPTEPAKDELAIPKPEDVAQDKEVQLEEDAAAMVDIDATPTKPKAVVTTAAEAPADTSAQDDLSDSQLTPSPEGPSTPVPEKKKKAHRGRRGGVKHKKNKNNQESSPKDEQKDNDAAVDEAIRNAKKLGDRPLLEPDVMTVANDMQAVTGPIIRMGNIEVNTEIQLGTGSNGTLVFAGKFDGREVAVKRMLIQFYDIASQETRLLRESDDHPNVIRYYSQQMTDGFLYIALERCAASLADVIEKPHAYRELANAGRLDLQGVLFQITNGISHLHNLRIVHRDLKPQNILINMGKGGKPRLLVSDFGLCKKLEGGQSSFGATTGRAAGTSGWRAPELLLDDDARETSMVDASTHSGSGSILNDGMPSGRRATRAIDIFSLGLVFFYVLTNGSHPFDCGDRYMREVNIRKGSYNLKALDMLGEVAEEAKDLIASMLDADPSRRPNAREVMAHPFFWPAKKRLAFLCDVSDHFEKEPRDPPSAALMELESHAMEVTRGDFQKALPREFLDSLGKQRKYTGSRLLDLLRALRNKKNHYEDMSDSLRKTVGALPDGYLYFWTTRFTSLLLVCWNVVYNVQWDETDRFQEYYEPAAVWAGA
ncbi:Putative Serine/threonine kinase IRE1 [[Torrubiella] hemipterigena]|uniref:non-specific serine/threonine protein kinase n=1 Tax=[Torrubiella] hemipterigena TaxID=1531966 RepID=A0A0A1TRB0_9HYPO|nr:Putative Serine/threonine kinase IRE1 [[Torrubiella] hemipterigena]